MAFCGHVSLWAINHKNHAEMSLHDRKPTHHTFLRFCMIVYNFQFFSMNGHMNILTC